VQLSTNSRTDCLFYSSWIPSRQPGYVSQTNTMFTNLSHCYAFIGHKELMFRWQLGCSRLPGAIWRTL